MSKRKDRERFQAMKRLNPDYPGFRGSPQDLAGLGAIPLVGVECSRCGKKRNVPVGVAQESGSQYVCLTCQEQPAQ